jgi:hypothetical protein
VVSLYDYLNPESGSHSNGFELFPWFVTCCVGYSMDCGRMGRKMRTYCLIAYKKPDMSQAAPGLSV